MQVHIADPGHAGSVSVRFNQDLNVHVGVTAPGTPANPYAFVSDDEQASPPHVLSAARKGARSKAVAKPGPRFAEQVSSSDAPGPSARGPLHDVPVAPVPAQMPAPVTPQSSSELSTQSFRDLNGFPIARARRMQHPDMCVWTTVYGRCYHKAIVL